MPSIKSTVDTAITDLSVIPTVDKTGIYDATVKFIVTTIDCSLFYNIINAPATRASAEAIKGQFKPLNDFLKMGAIFSAYPKIYDGFFKESTNRIFQATLLTNTINSGLDFVQGLQTFDLVLLGTISNALGRIPGWHFVAEKVVFTIAKDAVTLCSATLSLYTSATTLYNMNKNSQDQVISARIAVVNDLAKCALMSVSLTLSCTGYTTLRFVFAAVDLKDLQRSLSWCLSATGLYKAARTERFAR